VRASDVIERALAAGTLGMRTHVDIDTIGGLKPLNGVLALRDKYDGIMNSSSSLFRKKASSKIPVATS